ncbi:MAG: DNA polymerase IV [Spirochaetales bacterium]|nr:DNA polymerase IV [Spirochaetales bacterium]
MKTCMCHIDLDAFYASVEQADNPEYRGKPVIIGAKPGTRGVVSACSYEARKFGVKSAMPISQAYRKCPQGVYLPVKMQRYLEVSRQVMDIIRQFSPDFQQISIDEAFIDLTGTERLFGPVIETVKKIKHIIRETMGLTISAGIAPNKYLAKLASEYGKPDGLHVVPEGGECGFLDSIRLKDIWGIGEKTLQRLTELNITSVPMLREFPRHILCAMLGDATGKFLYNAARGKSLEIFSGEQKSHSISNEITFEYDVKDRTAIERTLMELSHQIMYRLATENAASRTVSIKLRYQDFTTLNAQKTLKHWLCHADEIYEVARNLFNAKWDGFTPIRLIGVSVSNVTIQDTEEQPELFEDFSEKKRKVEKAVFQIRSKLKDVKLTKASLLKKEIKETDES